MYEYKCINEVCGKTWTIREGQIGCTYLTCPFCQKGRGMFIRQIKEEINPDIEKLKLRKKDEDFNFKKPVNEEYHEEETQKTEDAASQKEVIVRNSENEIVTSEVNVEEDTKEDDIFERILKKRQEEDRNTDNEVEEEHEEDIDILEISGNSIEDIENRIKEFEEYFYIKVINKKIEQQGNRLNCIIKYCRK